MRQDQDILLLFILSCFVLAVNGRAARRITGKQLALLKRSVANIRPNIALTVLSAGVNIVQS